MLAVTYFILWSRGRAQVEKANRSVQSMLNECMVNRKGYTWTILADDTIE